MVPPPAPPEIHLVRLLASPRGRRSALLSSLQCLLSLTGSMGIVLLFAGIPQLIYAPEVTAGNVMTFLAGALLLTLMVAGNACIGYHYSDDVIELRDPEDPGDDKPPSYDELFTSSGLPPDYYSVVGSAEEGKFTDIAPVHGRTSSLGSRVESEVDCRVESEVDCRVESGVDCREESGVGCRVESEDSSRVESRRQDTVVLLPSALLAASSSRAVASSRKLNKNSSLDWSIGHDSINPDNVSSSSVKLNIGVASSFSNDISFNPDYSEGNSNVKSAMKASQSGSRTSFNVGKLRTFLRRSKSVNSMKHFSVSNDSLDLVPDVPDYSLDTKTIKSNRKTPNRSSSFCEESVKLV